MPTLYPPAEQGRVVRGEEPALVGGVGQGARVNKLHARDVSLRREFLLRLVCAAQYCRQGRAAPAGSGTGNRAWG